MENRDNKIERFRTTRPGRAFAGLVLVAIGGILLSRELGVDIPSWLLTWEALIIAIGFFIGAKRMFRPGGWMIVILVGVAFLLDHHFGLAFHHYVWPMVIILIGLWMILKPRRSHEWKFEESTTDQNSIVINTVFGGTKKKIMSKGFKGGEINSVFGGSDIDLMQADFEGTATLELNIVFGGVKLIIPPHWKIQSDVSAAFGSVEDKRRDAAQVADNKTLVLKGSVVFGSIEIKSY